MGQLRADISVSLDGFITGPNAGVGNGLGDGGERLHDWLTGLSSFQELHHREGGESNEDSNILEEAFDGVGAFVMGREMFDAGIGYWGDKPPFGATVFVVTHRAEDPIEKEGGTVFHFVTDGFESVVELAKEAAGDQDVAVTGGATMIQQAISTGLIDELQIHLVPILLGSGTPLFKDAVAQTVEMEVTRVVDSPDVTHIRMELAP